MQLLKLGMPELKLAAKALGSAALGAAMGASLSEVFRWSWHLRLWPVIVFSGGALSAIVCVVAYDSWRAFKERRKTWARWL